MSAAPRQISLDEWDDRYRELHASGLVEPAYGGPLRRHFEEGHDLRLRTLRFDNSAASLRLWNFLLTEEDRLRECRRQGRKLVGTMKDLGTVPVMAYAFPNLTAFYPDGAWWIPCVMEFSDGLLRIADSLGIDDSFCPVRAMLGAFLTEAHFPRPDLLVCSVGATCDDFSGIAQRLNGLGFPILWWEIPHRRPAESGEAGFLMPGGMVLPMTQVRLVKSELSRIQSAMEELAGERLAETMLAAGIRRANRVRRCLEELRRQVFMADRSPLPALELLIAEMMAIHFCSDQEQAAQALEELLVQVRARVESGQGFGSSSAARIYWVNPVSDLRVMNLLEDCGARLCGTDNMFCHALDMIPESLPPLDALAGMALMDPMAGSAAERAGRICQEMQAWRCEGLVISRIPGASHCAWEGQIIADLVHDRLDLPVVELEVPPVADSFQSSLRSRLEALVETIISRRPL